MTDYVSKQQKTSKQTRKEKKEGVRENEFIVQEFWNVRPKVAGVGMVEAGVGYSEVPLLASDD